MSRLKEEQHNCPGPAFTKASWNLGFILATRPQPSPRRGDAQGHQPPWLGLRIGCSAGGPRRAPGQPRSALHTGSVATASPAQATCVRTADGCQDARGKGRADGTPAPGTGPSCHSLGQALPVPRAAREFGVSSKRHQPRKKSKILLGRMLGYLFFSLFSSLLACSKVPCMCPDGSDWKKMQS